MNLRRHIRQLEKLENKAAEAVGMRILLMDEDKLIMAMSNNPKKRAKGKAYIKKLVGQMEADIFPLVVQSVRMGEALNKSLK